LTLADGLTTVGRNPRAHAVLARCLAAARRHLPGDEFLYVALLERIARVATGIGTQAAIDLARYHVELAPHPGPVTAAWDTILRAAGRVIGADPRGALALLDGLEDPPGDAPRRLLHIVANMAAQRTRSVEELRRRVGAAARWAWSTASRANRSLLAAWTGWLRFQEGRFVAAASLHARAARLATGGRPRVTALCNAATAGIEAGRLDAAQEHLTRAIELARMLRDTINLARAERAARVVAYRRGEDLAVDEDLLEATRRLDLSGPAGLTALCEAAVAWRAGDCLRGAELADEARAAFPSTGARSVAALAAGLAAACRGEPDPWLEALLVEEGMTLSPPGLIAQAAALAGTVAKSRFLPREAIARVRSWARGAAHPQMRREVLSPREVLSRLDT
jgi:tetratricopeptide (TPR) repeat protein